MESGDIDADGLVGWRNPIASIGVEVEVPSMSSHLSAGNGSPLGG